MEDKAMTGTIRTRILAACAMAMLLIGPALAQDAKGSTDARALIERQLDAFAHDDAPAAYAEAAPGITAMFTDPNTFMTMVREQYAPVYRHRSADFGPAKADADTIEQAVTFVDQNDQVWKALYKLTRQPDGKWLISGCSLVMSDDKST
jgi:Domain of unknown function (DUF4864)